MGIKRISDLDALVGALVATSLLEIETVGTASKKITVQNILDLVTTPTLSIQTVTSAATVTPVATNDKVVISAQAVGLTIANPSGTAAEGQGFVIALKDNATAQTIAFGVDYRGFDAALPTTTIAGKWMYIPVIRNHTESKWDVLKPSNQL